MFAQELYQNDSFKKAFLSDPSTYPLIVIMSTAMMMIVGMSANAFMNYKELRISPAHKHDVIPTWKDEKRMMVTEVISRNPFSFMGYDMKSLRKEGLGVEDWHKKPEQ